MDSLPLNNKICSYVAQQELKYSIPDIFNAEIKQNSINVVNATTNTASVCNFCGRPGHTKSNCYRKHRFPNNYDTRNSKGASTRGKLCSYCGKIGHTIEVCYEKHGYPLIRRFFNVKSSSTNSVSII